MEEKVFGELENVQFADGIEQMCPCVLLLDTSQSMDGEKILALNDGLRVFAEDIKKDTLARKRVDVAVVTFDSRVTVVQNFISAREFEPPVLSAQGSTAMGTGILKALDMVRERSVLYKKQGTPRSRPWVFLITDGEPYGEPENVLEQAAQRLREDEAEKRVILFAVGVQDANMARLQEIAVQPPAYLHGINFGEMFKWLSVSLQEVSHSGTEDAVKLPAVGWGTIEQA